MTDHEWESEEEWDSRLSKKIEYEVLLCHKTERSCSVVQGADFDHCPFCGDEIDND